MTAFLHALAIFGAAFGAGIITWFLTVCLAGVVTAVLCGALRGPLDEIAAHRFVERWGPAVHLLGYVLAGVAAVATAKLLSGIFPLPA